MSGLPLIKFAKQADLDPAGSPPDGAAGAQEDRLRRAGRVGLTGAVAGAGLGALRAALFGGENKRYLRDTLAGAMLGGLGTGASSYLAESGPFTRGSAPAKSYEAARQRFMNTMLTAPGTTPSNAAREALQTGLTEYLSGKHEFRPQEQQALAQQFIKARVPTGGGWRRRVNLLQRAITRLQSSPGAAAKQLALMQKVAPDPETRTYAAEALARIRSGAAAAPEGRHGLATLAQALQTRLPEYRKATNVVDALNVMKEMYGKGKLSEADIAKNLGVITGRFGSTSGQAERTRRLIQQMLASPVATHPKAPYARAAASPQISSLIERAMGR